MSKEPDDRRDGNAADRLLNCCVPKRRANALSVTDPLRYLSSYGSKGARTTFELLAASRSNLNGYAESYRRMIADADCQLREIERLLTLDPVLAGKEANERFRKLQDSRTDLKKRRHEAKVRLSLLEAHIRDLTPNL